MTGAALALMLGYCVIVGIELGAMWRHADEQKLRDLEPLRDVGHNEDEQQ